MFDFIRDIIRPPGIEQKNRASLFRIIGRIGGRVRDDITRIMRAFFPYLATNKEREAHGKALDVPRFPFDSDDDFRDRVAQWSEYHETRGWRSSILNVLDRVFLGRYMIAEYPGDAFRVGISRVGFAEIGSKYGFFVFIRNITDEERDWVYQFLDDQLDPHIEINVVEWLPLPA